MQKKQYSRWHSSSGPHLHQSAVQFVAYTPDAFYLHTWIRFEVVAQAGDIDIETAEIEVVVVAPEFQKERSCVEGFSFACT